MSWWLAMASRAGHRRPGIATVGMALGTGDCTVTSCQGKAGQAVVDTGPLPAFQGVAPGTVGAELAYVAVFGLVASGAGLGRASASAIRMALGTGHGLVLA